ncbi:V-type proton ATPase subunit E [Hibiscus syriacus]|uniref:V-type proton ATPase subunit E n=1 Tax=Hibiscus syriacus TaxID=106335 RepID=A0A6A2YXA2_HIBSY|nr:V-type proton ATPase subunit E [Hibiscus syriacus]
MQLNASRIKVLQAQDDVVNEMKESASKELLNVSNDHHVYKNLLKDVIVQYVRVGMSSSSILESNDRYNSRVHLRFGRHVCSVALVKLKEPAVLLRCLKDDVHLVVSVLDSAKEEYASKVNVDPPEIFIDDVHLPPAPSHHNAHGPFCSGGVVLASRDGKIVYENTLDARLDVAFNKKLPEIRKWLFDQVAA